jgi:hypothetical protein
VNPKAEIVEELLSRRKNLHLGMLKLAREDLALYLQAGIDRWKVTLSRSPPSPPPHPHCRCHHHPARPPSTPA